MSDLRRLGNAALVVTALVLAACDDDPTAPTIPGVPVVTAAAQSSSEIQVTWPAVPRATSYVVERAVDDGGYFEVSTQATTTFDDDGLDPAAQYRYRVAARSLVGQSAFSQEAAATPGVVVSANITTNTTWTSDNVYVLRAYVRVMNGATLTIQPGTKILGADNSALFIMRGAQIDAQGTSAQPIVFTSARPAGSRQPGDWAGLVIIGNAQINRASPTDLEGTGAGTGGTINYAGGSVNDDNSGTLRYVRVEFAGEEISAGNELNSFTFAAVGSGTTLEYLQSMSGLDDSFEWFGGTVDAKHLVSYESGDDHFDMSEGFSGRLQNLIALQTRILTPRPGSGGVSSDPQGIENDGCNGASCLNGEDSQPYTIPLVANFTLVGTGPGVVPNATSGIGMVLRRGTGGYYVNGHISRWPNGAISMRNSGPALVATETRLNAGDLLLRNILTTDGAAVFETGTNRLTVDLAANALELADATTTASSFTAFTAAPTSAADLDWSPAAATAQLTGGLETFTGAIATKAGTFVAGTVYRGAANPSGPKWWAGWTVYAAN
jgi:hypothetical protein